jgi:predicted metal-binding transcription factor (methanogenesis marker protein 9)
MEETKIINIMEETCFGSISYCCGCDKKCITRDSVIKKLGITKEEYKKLKEKFDYELFKILKKKTLAKTY